MFILLHPRQSITWRHQHSGCVCWTKDRNIGHENPKLIRGTSALDKWSFWANVNFHAGETPTRHSPYAFNQSILHVYMKHSFTRSADLDICCEKKIKNIRCSKCRGNQCSIIHQGCNLGWLLDNGGLKEVSKGHGFRHCRQIN